MNIRIDSNRGSTYDFLTGYPSQHAVTAEIRLALGIVSQVSCVEGDECRAIAGCGHVLNIPSNLVPKLYALPCQWQARAPSSAETSCIDPCGHLEVHR